MSSPADAADATLLLIAIVVAALSLAGAGVAGALWWRLRGRAAVLMSSLDKATTQFGTAAPDPRTGLIGRDEFELTLDEAALRCDRQGSALTLLFVDIDGFSGVNDAFGHDTGDAVLREAAERMHRASPDKTAVTRFGGDEFLLLLEGDLESAQRQARTLLAALATPFEVSGARTVQLAASIGIAAYPAHAARPRLVAYASTAMREVKQAGGNAYAVFHAQMAVDQQAQAALLADLRLPSRAASSSCITSPRSRRAACRSPRPRRCCAGATRRAAWSARRCSSLWPSGMA